MLGHPAFVAADDRGDAQGEAFLAEQGVAAVAAAVAHDEPFLGEVGDVRVLRVARPGDVAASVEGIAHRMEAFHVEAVAAQDVEDAAADARHDAHVDHHVGRVGDLHADAGDFRADRPHAEGDHIHRAALHAACVEAEHLLLHRDGILPVVGRTRVVLRLAADESALLHAGDIARIRADEEAVRAFRLVETDGRAGIHHELAEAPVLFL